MKKQTPLTSSTPVSSADKEEMSAERDDLEKERQKMNEERRQMEEDRKNFEGDKKEWMDEINRLQQDLVILTKVSKSDSKVKMLKKLLTGKCECLQIKCFIRYI